MVTFFKPQVKLEGKFFGQVKPQVKSQDKKLGQVKPQVKSQGQKNFKSSLKSSRRVKIFVKSSRSAKFWSSQVVFKSSQLTFLVKSSSPAACPPLVFLAYKWLDKFQPCIPSLRRGKFVKFKRHNKFVN